MQDVLDPQTGNWTVNLKIVDGFLRLDDWFVDWVEFQTDAPEITFRCNVSAKLDPKLTDAVRTQSSLREENKASIGSSCQRTGKLI